ncbi:MAG: CC0125/CC1285 family lipoprotein [Inquilinaceae bacterium]
MAVKWCCAILLVLATGCAADRGPTPYQPLADAGGFTEQRLADDIWRVQFEGNTRTPRATVENYLLHRAAELATVHGYGGVAIIEQEIERTTRYRAAGYPPPFPGAFHHRYPFYGQGYWPGYYGPERYDPINRYTGYVLVRAYNGVPPGDVAAQYDARDLQARLGPLIKRPLPAPE